MSWSLSKWETYEQCAAKYDYRYRQKLEDTKSAAMARGSSKHELLEGYIKSGGQLQLPPELLFYKSWIDQLIGTTTIHSEYKLALDKSWEPTDFDGDKAWFRCVIDLLQIGDKEAALYDWKTGKIYDGHDNQKELYAAAVFCALPEIATVRATHVYLDLAKNREKLFWRGMLPAIQERWNRRAATLESAVDFIPNPSFRCRFCSFSKFKGGPCRF